MMNLVKANVIVPKPTSVGVRIYYFAPDRVFSYGLDNDLCTGYGGWWRHTADDPTFAYDKVKTDEEPSEGGYDVGYWSTEV
jgi:hypothetical protein